MSLYIPVGPLFRAKIRNLDQAMMHALLLRDKIVT